MSLFSITWTINAYNNISKQKILDKTFRVHKVLLVASSDYFRSMFTTSGMRESHQSDIELKGVNARGLEKVIEILYTSCARFSSHADMFDTLAAANHLQCLLVVDVCERIFLSKLTCENFNYFMRMAKVYGMTNALRQIDVFIARNLGEILCQQEIYLKQRYISILLIFINSLKTYLKSS